MEYILLTGATGFIGSYLLERLLEENNKVIILKRSHSNTFRIDDIIRKFSNNIILVNIDIEEIVAIFEKYTVKGIIHLATTFIKNPFHNDINIMTHSNLMFPIELLDYAVRYNVKFFINTGTYYEYSQEKLPITEYSKIDSLNYYSTTKIAFEDFLKYYNKEYNIKVATLKLFTPYGPKDHDDRIIPYLIRNKLQNKEVNIRNPKNKITPVYVSDVVEAYIKLINIITSLERYEVFNIASNTSYYIKDIDNIINQILSNYDTVNYSKTTHSLCNCKKANNILKWKPKIDIKTGLMLTIEYYRNNLNRVK